MLRITIELLPGGDEERKCHVGTCEIANVGGDARTGKYRFRLTRGDRLGPNWRVGKVFGFPRKVLGPWDLLYRCLREAVGRRNP